MIWVHNNPKFKCYIKVINQDYKYACGKILYIEFGVTNYKMGDIINVTKIWGKTATEEELKFLDKILVFQ